MVAGTDWRCLEAPPVLLHLRRPPSTALRRDRDAGGWSAPGHGGVAYRIGMASYQIMSWRGIPSQVRATDGSGTTVNLQLPAHFQHEIDRVAMAEGLIDSDDYLEGWRWSDPRERDGSAEEVAASVATEVAEAFLSRDRHAARRRAGRTGG